MKICFSFNFSLFEIKVVSSETFKSGGWRGKNKSNPSGGKNNSLWVCVCATQVFAHRHSVDIVNYY